VESYAVTLERGTDGTYVGWVDDLPGCALRAPTRAELLARLPDEIAGFAAWAGEPLSGKPQVTVTREVESPIEADEDTEVLVDADLRPLTHDDLERLRPWIARSRAELLDLLDRLEEDDLARARQGSERTLREELEHVAFVELMYAAWTFDLHSVAGLADFLSWTRSVAVARLEELASRCAGDVTWADWGGAPRLEPWTARKAARRIIWHELLHLRALRDGG
jgi:hypothetical protein